MFIRTPTRGHRAPGISLPEDTWTPTPLPRTCVRHLLEPTNRVRRPVAQSALGCLGTRAAPPSPRSPSASERPPSTPAPAPGRRASRTGICAVHRPPRGGPRAARAGPPPSSPRRPPGGPRLAARPARRGSGPLLGPVHCLPRQPGGPRQDRLRLLPVPQVDAPRPQGSPPPGGRPGPACRPPRGGGVAAPVLAGGGSGLAHSGEPAKPQHGSRGRRLPARGLGPGSDPGGHPDTVAALPVTCPDRAASRASPRHQVTRVRSCSRPPSASGASPGSHVRERVSTGPGHRRRPGAGARPCTELAPRGGESLAAGAIQGRRARGADQRLHPDRGLRRPRIDYIVMARLTCSGLLYTQIVGRGVRPAPGTRDCVVIDVLGRQQVPRQQPGHPAHPVRPAAGVRPQGQGRHSGGAGVPRRRWCGSTTPQRGCWETPGYRRS